MTEREEGTLSFGGFIESLRVPPELSDGFNQELARRRVPGLWVLAITGTVLFPLFVVLDYLLYPEQLGALAAVRAVITVVALSSLFVFRVLQERQTLEAHSLVATIVLVLAYALGLDMLVIVAGGLGAPYYAGFILLIIVIASAIPIRARHLAGLLVFLVVQINLVDFMWSPERQYQLTITANFHLGASIFIGVLINAINQRLRLSEFQALRRIEAEKGRNDAALCRDAEAGCSRASELGSVQAPPHSKLHCGLLRFRWIYPPGQSREPE